jgi:hypothetical protein
MKKIYICGKITGMEWGAARAKFEEIEKSLKKEWIVINPIKVCKTEWAWEQCMIEDFSQILICDAIFIMNNWQDSKGAKIEIAVAKELGIELIYE